jgi:hypothetical protein
MYASDMTWQQWTENLNMRANALLTDIQTAKQQYDKWAAMTYGKSDEEIRALPPFTGHTVADITAMRYAWGVFNDLYGAMFGASVLPQVNREGYLAPFI